MTTSSPSATETYSEVAGLKVRILHEGSGEPVLVLHHDTGNTGWMPFHEELAKSFHAYVPDLPGYGGSDRPEWARNVRDYAALTSQLLDKLGLEKAPIVGLGYGGWIAAELATFNQSQISRLILVGAMGIQPRMGEIMDQFMVGYDDYVRAGFSTPEAFAKVFSEDPPQPLIDFWDFSREMTARITWKPYMFNQQLPHLLKEVRVPTLVVWGRDDKVVPLDCGQQYADTMPNAKLHVVENAGHLVDLEQPAELARLVKEHTSGN
jgi:pimeloyl-ACP methyl ester carboxylesterase